MTDLERILQEFSDPDDVDRCVAACEKLDRAADASWVPQLYHLLRQEGNFFLREAVAEPLIRLEGLRALPWLLHALELGRQEGHDNDGLNSSVVMLIEMNAREAAPILLAMIQAQSMSDRRAAAWLLGFIHEEITPEPILAALGDDDAGVRGCAAGSLASFKGRPEVLEALIGALGDPDPQVRVDAASSLGYYGDSRATTALEAALEDPDERVQSFARYSLERLG